MVMGIFQLPDLAEQAVAELSLNGFTENDVSVVTFQVVEPPPDKTGLLNWLAQGGALGDTLDRTDGVSVMDGVSVGAVIGGILGLAWGSKLRLGSVTIGTLGMLLGGLLGYLADRLIPERRRGEYEMSRAGGVLMVQVTSPQLDRLNLAKKLLEGNRAKQTALVDDAPPLAHGGR